LPAAEDVEDPVSQRHRRLVAIVPGLLAAGCLGSPGKITTQQALVEEAFQSCRAQGPATRLARVERDGHFTVVGPETQARRVHECMVRYAEPPKRQPDAAGGPAATAAPPATAPPATAPPTAAPPPAAAVSKPGPVVASRLPGTWRGTLTVPPRSPGQAEGASPATVRFVVAGGALRWTLAAGVSTPTVAADGTAVVVDGELRMTGTIRAAPTRTAAAEAPRPGTTIRYAGKMVGDRLDLAGVTTDKQVHALSVQRVAE
jgi:hypothetical protein